MNKLDSSWTFEISWIVDFLFLCLGGLVSGCRNVNEEKNDIITSVNKIWEATWWTGWCRFRHMILWGSTSCLHGVFFPVKQQGSHSLPPTDAAFFVEVDFISAYIPTPYLHPWMRYTDIFGSVWFCILFLKSLCVFANRMSHQREDLLRWIDCILFAHFLNH